jgi:hypothetical protein
MEPKEPKLLAAHLKAIKLLELLARSIQGLLAVAIKGPTRDRAVMRLAAVDQNLANRKEKLGILGKDDCAYLNN